MIEAWRDLTSDDQSPGVGVDGWQPAEVLPDLLQVLQALVLPPHDGRHPTQGSSLQLLTPAGTRHNNYIDHQHHQVLPVQRVTELQEPDVVLGHVINEVPGCVDLTQRQLVMVFVVQNVHKICVERMDVFQLGKVLQDLSQLLGEILLGEFDLPHVKTADARNFVMFVDDCRGLPLGLGEDNVGEVGAGGDNTDLLEVVVRHDCNFTTATSETVFITVGRLLGYID